MITGGRLARGLAPRTPAAEDPVPSIRKPIPLRVADGFYARYGKRCIDVVGASLALVLTLPLLVLVCLAVRLESSGPALYRSLRCGLGGRPFVLYKVRSMRDGVELTAEQRRRLNQVSEPAFKAREDPRLTPLGRLLRRTSIDELPQLWNVLRGEMSLVGPRPPLPSEVERYEDWQLQRLAVLPGLTCLWQISGRSLIGFEEWVRLDLEYIQRRGLGTDLRILLATVPTVLSGRGAF
jgi:lipopolysaccharide/colanic/teichoic acid biosynthesis glycosyltransferase